MRCIAARAGFEIGHLLNDVGCGQARERGILRTALAARCMAIAAGIHLGRATGRHDRRHGRMRLRKPIHCIEHILELRRAESRIAARKTQPRLRVGGTLTARRIQGKEPRRHRRRSTRRGKAVARDGNAGKQQRTAGRQAGGEPRESATVHTRSVRDAAASNTQTRAPTGEFRGAMARCTAQGTLAFYRKVVEAIALLTTTTKRGAP